MMQQVVVTGMGAVTPIGNSVSEFTTALFEGRSGADPLQRFEPAELATRFAAEVKGVEHEYKDVKLTFGLLAAAEAMQQAFGDDAKLQQVRAQLSIGIGLELFSMPDLIASRRPGFELPTERREAMSFLNTPSDLVAHIISRQYAFSVPPMIHISACAASTDAIGKGFEAIRDNRADVVLAGGADSMINPMGLGGFSRIGALSTRNDDPHTASRPFDKTRDGFMLGEGAGFIVLESEQHAHARNAPILARISGYGNSLDAWSVSDPHPEGAGALRAMRAALQSAGLTSRDISAVNAHGTSTEKNDPAETCALQTLLGDHCPNVPVHATKSMIGHLISASGAVETIAVISCMQQNSLHHTANLQDVDEACLLDHVLHSPRQVELQHVLKNSFGFGGKNACLVVSRK